MEILLLGAICVLMILVGKDEKSFAQRRKQGRRNLAYSTRVKELTNE